MLKRGMFLVLFTFGLGFGSRNAVGADSVLESPSALHRDDRASLSDEDYLGGPQRYEQSGSIESDVEANRWKPGPGYNPEQAMKSAVDNEKMKGQ